MVNKRISIIISIVIATWVILNGISYFLSYYSFSSFNQINEDVVSIHESVSMASLVQHKIVSFYMETGKFPINNEALGIGAPETFDRRAVSKITGNYSAHFLKNSGSFPAYSKHKASLADT